MKERLSTWLTEWLNEVKSSSYRKFDHKNHIEDGHDFMNNTENTFVQKSGWANNMVLNVTKTMYLAHTWIELISPQATNMHLTVLYYDNQLTFFSRNIFLIRIYYQYHFRHFLTKVNVSYYNVLPLTINHGGGEGAIS